jgi:hypothetical protein
LVAAAYIVLSPREYHPRLRLTEAEQFLDACRVVPSEPGYALTLACPLNPMPSGPCLPGVELFPRRVTGLLMRSIHRLAEMVDTGHGQTLIQSPDLRLLSGNLCEALLLMRPVSSRFSLTFRATWARTGSLACASLPSAVNLGPDHFSVIEQLALRLRPRAGGRRELFIGFVEVLRGVPGADGRPDGEVMVSILRDEAAVTVCLHLDADDYALAGQAHLQHQPVRFEGVLHRGPRLNRIDEVTGFARVEKPVAVSAG